MEPDGSFDDDDLERWHEQKRIRGEVIVLTVIGVLLCLVFGPVVYLRSWISEPVFEVVVVTPTELELAVGTCGHERRVRVTEHDEAVEVLVQYRRSGRQNDCVEYMSARLDGPLGARRVVDRFDESSISVCPAQNVPRSRCEVR